MKTKDQYHLRNLSKIKHKPWELFVISRILHNLNDPDIEYVCQQYINVENSDKSYLADICFPSLKIYYEIDESQHASERHIDKDQIRQREILEATDWDEYRIKVHNGDSPPKDRPMDEVIQEVDEFICFLKKRKKEIELIPPKKKIKWDFNDRFNPKVYKKEGKINVEKNVVLLNHRDCLRLFGYQKGHYQRAWWPIKVFNEAVWFPKLYPNNQWRNLLSSDGSIITQEQVIDGKSVKHDLPSDVKRIVFAHYKNIFGQTVYKFYGKYAVDWDRTDEYFQTFKRISNELDLKKYSKQD